MGRLSAILAAGPLLCAVVSPAGAAAAQAPACGVNLASPTVQTALNVQPPPPFPDSAWSRDPSTYEGNFDPCRTLSVAIVPLDGGTGSSPSVALLFNRSIYVGPASPEPRGFTSLNPAATTDDTVGLTFKTPGSCNACGDGTYYTVRYRWTDGGRNDFGRLVRLDPLPPSW